MPITIERYAIRKKSTGEYLPAPIGRGGRGGTHVEPAKPTVPGFEPRLFHNEVAAKIALTYWLQGRISVTTAYDSYYGEVDDDWSLEPVPERNRDDMEIVTIKLELP